jgi:hypothetical protein
MANDEPDDDYVANLLKQDAKAAAKKYELVGIDAFNQKRCVNLLPRQAYSGDERTSAPQLMVTCADGFWN